MERVHISLGVASLEQVFFVRLAGDSVGPGRGLHLRDFLVRVSLLHVVLLCTRCRPPPRIIYTYMPELLDSILFTPFVPSFF